MKKENKKWVSLILLYIVMFSACAAVEKPKNHSSFDRNNFDKIVKKLNSAEIISEYMIDQIHYTSSSQRYSARKYGYWWKTPQETFNDKYGFCYDLSAFALYCLVENGHANAKILFVCWGDWGNKSNTGHLVCMFEKNNKYHSIDNGKLKGSFNTLEQLIESASRKREVKGYKFFHYNEIPFHIPYKEMNYFCSEGKSK